MMKRRDLRRVLECELEAWSQKGYDELVHTEFPVVYDNGGEGSDFYQAEIQLLHRGTDYLQVSVAVDDGGWRSLLPVNSGFLIFSDGRVEK